MVMLLHSFSSAINGGTIYKPRSIPSVISSKPTHNIKFRNTFIDTKSKFSIIHARLRNFCSNLNQDVFDKYLRIDPTCSCQKAAETAEHYFFKCEHARIL